MHYADYINKFGDGMFWNLHSGILLVGILFAVVFALAFYIYFALAWSTIAKKLKYKRPWLAWIPFANLAMILQLGGFGWGWIFLFLIPILGWIVLVVLMIIATWRIFEKRNYPGWFSLSMIIPKIGAILYVIIIGFVAWKDKRKVQTIHHRTARRKRRR
jgi:hypothetical protein